MTASALRAFAFLISVLVTAGLAEARERVAVAFDAPEGRALVERIRQGGLVLFFRHADTLGMPCDRSFRVGDREGQRNISQAGISQSRRVGEAFSSLGLPFELPVLAGPVYRARDTAEHAFAAARVRITDDLTADDFSGPRLAQVIDGHRRLMSAPVSPGTNRILVGHRTPAIMVFGPEVGGRAFPEGAALVIEPGSPARVLGILMLAPIPGGGFHGC